jgi:hypothetical protein
MHGNGTEWMHDGPPLPADLGRSKRDDRMEKQILSQNDVRWLRSCDVTGTADSQRVYSVTSNPMGNHFGCIRPARTLRPKSQPETAQTSP